MRKNNQNENEINSEIGNSDKVHKAHYGRQVKEVHHHYYYEPDSAKRSRSSKPGIAGVLLIITAVLGLIVAGCIISQGTAVSNLEEGSEFWGLSDKSDVAGQITTLNGKGVENVTVSIEGEGITTQTDEDGYYALYNVPIGKQKIKVEKDGYNTYLVKVVVPPTESNWDNDYEWNHRGEDFDLKISSGDQLIETGSYPPMEFFSGIIYSCGLLLIIFSVLILAAGVVALKRKNFGLAVTGAVLGIFTVVGALFAIIALFILLISRDEFKRGEK
jgi:hypothetical protein